MNTDKKWGLTAKISLISVICVPLFASPGRTPFERSATVDANALLGI